MPCYVRDTSLCSLLPFERVDISNAMLQHRAIVQRKIPDALKLAIAKRIENNLFSKVRHSDPHCNMRTVIQTQESRVLIRVGSD